MTQFRMMTILLFVCLSLCFKVAQSELKYMYSPCRISDECDSKCCHRDDPNGAGICIPYSPQSCYGSHIGERCYNSNECYSWCCHQLPYDETIAICVPRSTEPVKCFGPNLGDSCYSSDNCYSGCCSRRNIRNAVAECVPKEESCKCFGSDVGDFCSLSKICNSGCCQRRLSLTGADESRCAPKAAENQFCDPIPTARLYSYCPCESGLKCAKSGTGHRICKKPNTENFRV
ncbi:leucine-rich colipase-like protein 1 [Eleutherodactylus coqui]|uniref:leucine-rich colipase-like protein 1 n=1 Tax=Eleutherodactylus coqui TaxID=57060 RepID=UPI0034636AC6